FFQAEDGIRDSSVTGVQTCALPISAERDARRRLRGRLDLDVGNRQLAGPQVEDDLAVTRSGAVLPDLGETGLDFALGAVLGVPRSEERRVGKECGTWGWCGQLEKVW